MDWDSEARRAVTFCRDELFEAHRGALAWDARRGILLAFGNDGYSSPRGWQRRAAELVREHSPGKLLAFAVCDDNYSWAQLIGADCRYFEHSLAQHERLVWWAYQQAVSEFSADVPPPPPVEHILNGSVDFNDGDDDAALGSRCQLAIARAVIDRVGG